MSRAYKFKDGQRDLKNIFIAALNIIMMRKDYWILRHYRMNSYKLSLFAPTSHRLAGAGLLKVQ